MQYDGGFIIGGPLNRHATPNFRLREYADAEGRIRIHRDLVASVQIIRADCISRRLTILEREPRRVIEAGRTAVRNNRMLYLVRSVGVKNIEQYLL